MPKRRTKEDLAHDVRIGSLIRSQRTVKNLSQTELADKINVTFQQIQKYEKGTNRVSASRLTVIAETLGVNIDFFYKARGSGNGGDSDAIQLLSIPHAVRLLRAFAKIKSTKSRTAITNLAEHIAEG